MVLFDPEYSKFSAEQTQPMATVLEAQMQLRQLDP
jgi:hypothetical protein